MAWAANAKRIETELGKNENLNGLDLQAKGKDFDS